MKRTLILVLLTTLGLFKVHAISFKDSIHDNAKLELIENHILNHKPDSAIFLIKTLKSFENGTYINLLERIALKNNITYKDYYTFSSAVGNRPNLTYGQLSKFINLNVKEPQVTNEIQLDYVFIKWLQNSKLRDYATIEEANEIYSSLEKYISKFEPDQPNTIGAKILLSTHDIVLHIIQKKFKEGKNLCLINLEKARQLNDPIFQIVTLYHLSDFLLEENKLQEYIEINEESLILEKELLEKSPYYTGTIVHLLNAYIFAGGYDNRVDELLSELYTDPLTKVYSYSLYAQYLRTLKPNSISENEIFKLLGVRNIVEFCDKTKMLSENVLNPNDMYHLLNESAYAMEKRGFYKEANSFRVECMRLRESIYSKDLTQSLVDYDTKQMIKQKENEIVYAQEKNWLYSMLAVLFTSLFIITLLALYKNRKHGKQLNAKNEIIKKSLAEKDDLLQKNQLLFKEMHHRIKNNFQIVSSLFELQSKGVEDRVALKMAKDNKNRLNAMALIHQKLYQNDEMIVEIDEYIAQLVSSISHLYLKDVQPKISMQIPHYKFDIDTAIPLGLIINEIITNAFKYGFDQTNPILNISLSKTKDFLYKLSISDNGKGLPTSFDFEITDSLGLRLIRRLSKQLHGMSSYSSNTGCNFIVVFKDSNLRLKMA